ncbi:MAG: hypothetical protein IJ379_00280 [Lachnospiraceae bacterium]|nr:hypothetical protein [Lachnospiraceae bacterium]
MEENKDKFEYTYSAKQQEEIEKIRKKYLPKEEDKLELLKKLDRDVTKPGTVCAMVIGVVGCLVFGLGMSCALVWGDTLFIVGIIAGIIGIGIMGMALPVYNRVTAKQREKIAPQILALTEELTQ